MLELSMKDLYLLILGGILLLGLFLLTQRWFWLIALGLSALASAFACIASIIHFEIFAAVGYFILALILLAITAAITE
jgi:hypothetical protein